MSVTIITKPDETLAGLVNFSGNLRKFEIESDAEVSFLLQQGGLTILDEKYQPNDDDEVIIDVSAVIERLLEVVVPDGTTVVTEQTTGYDDFVATITGTTPIVFRVIKGGVAELTALTANDWLEAHFLTWQPQTKFILQEAPEWLSIYPLETGTIEVKAWFADGSYYANTYANLTGGKLYSVDTSWGEIAEWLLLQQGSGSGSGDYMGDQPVAWDVWYEVGGIRKTAMQRYQLRYPGDEEHLFVWGNTLGGVDSFSFTGGAEEDEKLEHFNALYDDDTVAEYDIEKSRQVRQATGNLSVEESFWLKDFFYSRKKYVVRADGSLRAVAVVESKVISVSLDDEYNYEFTYRMGVEYQLLNTERTHTVLPAPEGLADFFLTDLLSGLTEASYADNLIMAVQSPYAVGWQKLSMWELWGGALPGLIDNRTIKIVNGKLTVNASLITIGGGTVIIDPSEDSATELISGNIFLRPGSGYTYDSTDIIYKIMGVTYTAAATTKLLAHSDPNLDRMDVFYVDEFSNLCVAQGTPAANPAEPILTSRQLFVMAVLVKAGSLEPEDIEIEIIYNENVEWATGETHDADTSVNFESIEDVLSGTFRIKTALAIPDSAVSNEKHYVGQFYGGGVIFKLLNAAGTAGLIVSETDVATSEHWSTLSGGNATTGSTAMDIGSGLANSNLMLANSLSAEEAVSFCTNFVVDGFDDWYMPSQGEMNEIYVQRMKLPGLATNTYWTSSEHTYLTFGERRSAWCVSFANGTSYTRLKSNTYNVRAIRNFDDVSLPVNQPIEKYAPEHVEMTFVSPGQVIVTDGILSFIVKSTADWLDNSVLMIESWLGLVRTGTVAMGKMTNMFSYKPGNDGWKRVVIQMYNFAPSKSKLDCFRFRLEGTWPNNFDLGLDDIWFQHSNVINTNQLRAQFDRTDYRFVETPNGSLTDFTTLVPYVQGTTRVHINGVRQIIGTDQHYIEEDDLIKFKFHAPTDKSGFVIDYKTYWHE